MPKKISRVLSKQRPFAGDPYALVNHVHPPDFPPVAADIAARDLLAGDQRYEGVIIYVQSDLTTYQLRGGISNNDWTTLVTATGVASHFELGDIGTTSHVDIDAHIADSTIHFTEASISITESQISDLQGYSLPSHDHDLVYLAIAGTAAIADALSSATSTIDVSAAAQPLIGQVLTATSHLAATWQFPPGGGASGGDIIQTGTPTDTFVAYFTADKNLSGDAGMTWITASTRLNITGINPVIRLQDNNNPAITMTSKVEFFDQTSLIGEVGFLSGNTGDLSLKNIAGAIRFDTDGTADVVVTGDGNIAIGGFIDFYAGSPVDGSFLVWVTANARAEFIVGPSGIEPIGVPVDNEIVVFDGPTSADGDPNFTWDQVLFTADGLRFNNANDQMVIGSGDLTNPGIFIDGNATATPAINLQQAGATRAIMRFSDSADRLELSSSADEIALRPGNIDTLVLTSTLSTLSTQAFVVQGGSLTVDDTIPQIRFQENDEGLDQKNSQWVQENGIFDFNIADDAYANFYTWLSYTRSGTGAGIQVDAVTLNVPDVTVSGNLLANNIPSPYLLMGA